jgi:hypothetical protein
MPPATGKEDAISAIETLTIHAEKEITVHNIAVAFEPAIFTANANREVMPVT